MKINLRKSNAMQVAINEALKGLELVSTVNLNEFQDAAATIQLASNKFASNLARRNALLDALYEIRKAVAVANSNVGIDARLADVARLEKDIQFFAGHAKAEAVTDLAVINGRLDKIRSRTEDAYSFRGLEVATSIFTAASLENFRNTLSDAKKQKQKLQDELLELNVRTEIDLSDATVNTLTNEGIL
jgi:hypothetical protein